MSATFFRMLGHHYFEHVADPPGELQQLFKGVEALMREKGLRPGPVFVRKSPVMAATTFDFLGETWSPSTTFTKEKA